MKNVGVSMIRAGASVVSVIGAISSILTIASLLH
jgi:hypothetical protein